MYLALFQGSKSELPTSNYPTELSQVRQEGLDVERKIINLPCDLFGPQVSDWILNVRGRAANDGVTGAGQVIYGNQPRWEATLKLAGVRRERVLTWRSIRAQMRGRLNILRVCVCDRWRPTNAQLGLPGSGSGGVPHSDGAFFSDGSGYVVAPTIIPSTNIIAGNETMTVNVSSVKDSIRPGHFFSHNDWLYQVTGVTGTLPVRTIAFEPPLRRTIMAGTSINVGEAYSLMAFVDDLQGRMPLQDGKRGETDISLVEWTNRP